ncbi:MAG: maltotransferase domain-containing protein, partial [Desulfurivibrionaceae bacterium]
MAKKETLHILPEEKAGRVWIEHIRPRIDCGRFPIKRTLGEKVVVRGHAFADGHDLLKAVLQYRHGENEWHELPMTYLADDLWSAEFQVDHLGIYQFTITAWIDHFATWQRDLLKKFEAGQRVTSELLEGAAMVEAASGRARAPDDEWLAAVAAMLRGNDREEQLVRRADDDDLSGMMNRYPDRARQTTFKPTPTVVVEAKSAGFSAWYEIFPRSLTADPARSGTFADLEKFLPQIARMGFDVLYLPPIHPIGHTNRKGRNNALAVVENDPGSPWAIGSEEGGHKAIHPALGTLEDFKHLVAEAKKRGLHVAMDIAYQVSPDHPYVREHPDWFIQRPDGTIQY